MSIRTKLVASVLLVCVLGVLAVMLVLGASYGERVDDAAKASVARSSSYYAAAGVTSADLGSDPGEAVATLEEIMSDAKALTGDDFGLLLSKDVLDEEAWNEAREAAGKEPNWEAEGDLVVASVTNPEWEDEVEYEGDAAAVPDDGEVLGRFEEEGERSEIRGVFPLKDANGKLLGLVFTMHDIAAEDAEMQTERLKLMAVVALMALLIAVAVVVLADRLVFGRLTVVMATMEDISTRVAGGDYTLEYAASGSKDEIGRFESLFASFIRAVGATLKSLAAQASGK